jgi:hypothetical protein
VLSLAGAEAARVTAVEVDVPRIGAPPERRDVEERGEHRDEEEPGHGVDTFL